MLKSVKYLVLAVLCCVSLSCDAMALAEDVWPQFRGPTGQGLHSSANVPTEFDLERGVRWRTPIEGKGWSSPVLADGRVWLTTALATDPTAEQLAKLDADPQKEMKELASSVELYAICIEAESGEVLHRLKLATIDNPDAIHPLNTFASPTPVIHQARVVCHFGTYGTWCLDAKSGKQLWSTRVELEHGVGPGSSPLVADGALILVCDGMNEQFIIALDMATGDQLWRTERPALRASSPDMRKSYSSPLAVTVNGSTQVVIPGAQWICGYDPMSGKELWRADHGDGFSLSPTAIDAGGLVVFSTGYMRPELVAVRPDGKGDVTKSHVVWRVSRGAPNKPSPIFVDGRIYVVSDAGILTQIRPEDGSIAWQERLSGNFSASPISVDGKIYFCSHEGVVTVVAAGDSFQSIASNQLEGRLMASPAVVGDDLLIRSEQALMRIGR